MKRKDSYSKHKICLKCYKLITNGASYCQKCLGIEKLGKNNPNYKHGKYIVGPKFCIDCNKETSGQGIRCRSCAAKITGFKKGRISIISEETRKKISNSNLGKIRSNEIRRKYSEGHKGQISWSKGLTKESDERVRACSEKRKGQILSEEARKNMRKAAKNRPPVSEETKQKMRGRIPWNKNKTGIFSEESLEKMRAGALKHLEEHKGPFKDTTIELSIKIELNALGISYIQQKRILKYSVDFYLPKYNIIIECDGDYFHANPRKYKETDIITGKTAKEIWEQDTIRNEKLINAGYKVYRFWEHEIKNGAGECICRVKELSNEIITKR